jgi:tetratricopeptide (TPR) repeat protein
MSQIHKTVFISYRRTDQYIARSVYEHLTRNGYNCFLDYLSINSGDWLQVILNQVRARAHFLLILTPSTLERCVNQDDILRQEIEQAVRERRNIVSLLFENADLGKMGPYLASPELKALLKYNALPVPEHGRYFDDAMRYIRQDFLNVALDTVLHPVPSGDALALRQNEQIGQTKSEQIQPLNAAEWYTRGYESPSSDEQIYCYSEALNLQANFAEAYINRALAYFAKKDYGRAISDLNQALHLQPLSSVIYHARGNVYFFKEDYDRAIADYDQALGLKPDDAMSYYFRGMAYFKKRKYDRSIADYDQAIRLKPDDVDTYIHRGLAYLAKGNHDRAIADYRKSLHYKRDNSWAYYCIGQAYHLKGDYEKAISSYQLSLVYDPNNQDAKENLALALKRSVGIFQAIKNMFT